MATGAWDLRRPSQLSNVLFATNKHPSRACIDWHLSDTHTQDTVGAFKERLAGVLALAANKQRLTRDGVGFMRDEFSLAFYNISPDVSLVLGTKERGGRKK